MRKKTLMLTHLIFFGAAVALIILSFFSYQRINMQVRAGNEVNKTQLLKFKLNDAFSHLIKTETAQRGLILSGDSSFLYDYFLAKQQIPRLLTEIETLVTDNADQNTRLRQAARLFQTRLNYIQSTLEIHRKLSKEKLDSVFLKGKLITDELNSKMEQMIAAEDHLLGQRIALKQKEERTTSVFIFLFSILSIGILSAGFFTVKTEIFNNALLEQKVKERTEELNISNEILQKQNLELKRKNNELSSFSFVANHDLKEPLRKIEFFTNRILSSSQTISTENKDLLLKTIEGVKRMKELLEDIFVYTLTDRIAPFEKTNLNTIAELSIENLKEMILEKGAVIDYDGLPEIEAVPQHMEKLFTNLLSNALKYSKKNVKPHIKIEAKKERTKEGEYWKICFTDNGIGFNEMHREKIFEMFQRLHPRYEYEGTGMGLTICKKIVENHGGIITASSKDGEGSIFTVPLPAHKSKTT